MRHKRAPEVLWNCREKLQIPRVTVTKGSCETSVSDTRSGHQNLLMMSVSQTNPLYGEFTAVSVRPSQFNKAEKFHSHYKLEEGGGRRKKSPLNYSFAWFSDFKTRPPEGRELLCMLGLLIHICVLFSLPHP